MKVSHSTRALIGAVALCLLTTGALAQGVVDQENDPTASSGFGCGTDVILNGTVLQSFVPAEDTLIAVTLRLKVGTAFPANGYTSTIRVLEGSSSGTVVAQATALVDGTLNAGDQVLVRFDFATADVVPGDTYLIEWTTPPTTVLTWVGASGDPYADGTAYSCSGNVWPVTGTDFNFITWAEEPVVDTTSSLSCAEMLQALRDEVDALDLNRCAKKRLDRHLRLAACRLERGKAKSAYALVGAFEHQVRIVARFGALDEADAEALIEMAEAFRDCLRNGDCDMWHQKVKKGKKAKKHKKHGHDH